MYEVELKFPLIDAEPVIRRLAQLGAEPGAPQQQTDFYFNHPARDFEHTDEALRIRSVERRHIVTYKGPIVDSQTKTRREIEVLLEGDDAAGRFAEILRMLGFRPVREVCKRRQPYPFTWQNRPFEIALDEVDGLGRFVEIETQADEAGRAIAIDAILACASQFQLGKPEKRSYLCLLLEKDRKSV
jgi:adenylate cyclase class 2